MKRTFRQVVNDGWKILREDIYGVRGVIIALALYFLFFRYILRSICPVVLVTGFPCPGCGMTRAWLQALRLDFAGAFRWHPLFWTLPLLVLLFLFCNRLPKKAVVAAAAILAVLFAGTYIVRMVWLFPRTPPMTVNENAPLNRLLRLFRWLT